MSTCWPSATSHESCTNTSETACYSKECALGLQRDGRLTRYFLSSRRRNSRFSFLPRRRSCVRGRAVIPALFRCRIFRFQGSKAFLPCGYEDGNSTSETKNGSSPIGWSSATENSCFASFARKRTTVAPLMKAAAYGLSVSPSTC